MKVLNIIFHDNGIPSFDSSREAIEAIRKNYRVENLVYRSITDIAQMPDKTFYFIIKHTMSLYDYITINDSLPVNPDIITYLRTYKNLNIIFISDTEPDSENVLKELHEFAVHNDLNEKQLIVINNNYLLSKINIYDFQVYTSHRLDMWIVEYLRQFEPEFKTDKQMFFTCHNRVVKPHRYFLLANLKKMDYLEDTDWSFIRAKNDIQIYKEIGQGDFPTTFYEHLYDTKELDGLTDEMYYLDSVVSKTSIFEQTVEFDVPGANYMAIFENNSYKNAYVNLTTESRFDYYGIHITEKSILPFYFYQIPLILASPGHIAAMKERYDFDFFEDVVDIGYDNIKNHKERFQAYLKQVEQLYNSKDQIIDFYKKNKSRFIKNREKVLNLLKADSDYKYFNGVISKEEGKIL